jgi:hypothetical protein
LATHIETEPFFAHSISVLMQRCDIHAQHDALLGVLSRNVLKAINLPRGNQMPELKKTSSKESNNEKKPIRQHRTAKAGRKPLTIAIQAGESDERAFRWFINDCLIPIFAERFISDREKNK